MTDREKAESEERMKPLVEQAEVAARHFIATIAEIVVTARTEYATQKEAEEHSFKVFDAAQKAFCEAFVTGWRMMVCQEVENGLLDFSIFRRDVDV